MKKNDPSEVKVTQKSCRIEIKHLITGKYPVRVERLFIKNKYIGPSVIGRGPKESIPVTFYVNINETNPFGGVMRHNGFHNVKWNSNPSEIFFVDLARIYDQDGNLVPYLMSHEYISCEYDIDSMAKYLKEHPYVKSVSEKIVNQYSPGSHITVSVLMDKKKYNDTYNKVDKKTIYYRREHDFIFVPQEGMDTLGIKKFKKNCKECRS